MQKTALPASCLFVALVMTSAPALRAQDTGSIPPVQRQDPMIQKIVSEISDEKVAGIMQKLETFGTRNLVSDPTQKDRGIGAARQWIFDQFKSYSPRLQVSFDTYDIKKTNRIYKDIELRNVVAILPGRMKEASNRWILVSGHYDSLNLQVGDLRNQPDKAAEVVAPGVSDDGSGTACAMECARVLSQHEFDATLVFVAFAGEEQGLVGAHAMAKRLRAQRQEIEAVLNNDIIGNDVAGNGSSDNRRVLVFSEDPNDSPSRQVARFVHGIAGKYYPEFLVDMIFRHDRFGRGGDHTAFNQEGYAGVRFTTPSENFANQHSPTDTFANASPSYTSRVIRVNAASAAAMALAPRAPITMPRTAAAGGARAARGARGTNATETATEGAAAGARRGGARGPGLTRGTGYDAVLRWEQPDPEPDLAGFMVVVRSTTAPDWEREIWAGNVREFTLKNMPIDQSVFGVKAVDKEGHESPVSAYYTAPRRVDEPASEYNYQ